MIKKLRVRNFLSLKEVDLELHARNVLVGPNMSGKSNLIDCLRFISAMASTGGRPHLLYGNDPNYIRRMADCIYDPAFKLDGFAESCVEETLGWVQDGVPLCNSRVLRTLRWLGFDLDTSLT